MEKNGVGMCGMIACIIQDGQLSVDEEDALRKLLVQRSHERRCRSLSEYIQRESRKYADIAGDEVREVQERLYRYCIIGRDVGGKPVSDLTEDDVRKFIILTVKSYEMDRKSWFVFLSMLQMALNAMANEGVLGFEPPRRMYEDFSKVVKRKRSVEKPYDGDDWERIKGWLEQHPKDVRGLALALWFEGGISPEEIAGLKKSDLLDCSGGYSDDPVVVKKNAAEDYLLLSDQRKQVIRAALELYPGMDQEYVFMDWCGGKLEKLAKTSLQPKMASICRQAGVQYKTFKCTDMILWGLD